jgi:hypothetical protein
MAETDIISIHKSCPMQIKAKGKICAHYIDALNVGEAGFCDSETRFRCVEALKTSQPTLSHSAAMAWVKCKMYFYYYYILGIRVNDEYKSDALKRGSVWDAFMNGEDYKVIADKVQLGAKDRIALSALIDAYTDLEIIRPEGQSQVKVSYPYLNNTVVGFVDWGMEDGFEEWKMSSSPNYYLQHENIFHQVGTYFMSVPAWQYVDIKPAQMPQLRTGGTRGKYVSETDEQFYRRIYEDILARPSFYFVGYDRSKRTWGKRFYRKEFDLSYLESMYKWIFIEIRETLDRGSWYRNDGACKSPFECDYLDIKKTGVVSRTQYHFASRKIIEEGEGIKEVGVEL